MPLEACKLSLEKRSKTGENALPDRRDFAFHKSFFMVINYSRFGLIHYFFPNFKLRSEINKVLKQKFPNYLLKSD